MSCLQNFVSSHKSHWNSIQFQCVRIIPLDSKVSVFLANFPKRLESVNSAKNRVVVVDTWINLPNVGSSSWAPLRFPAPVDGWSWWWWWLWQVSCETTGWCVATCSNLGNQKLFSGWSCNYTNRGISWPFLKGGKMKEHFIGRDQLWKK